ncbi:DUF4232 domain-containing protein [Amycolatopsis saalfeldensis]|uniref:DUF4232 domain-containing protein n=1 Tax=Amycolatopsis saalfeldensis TaxID=394193 RepID=A0A1H8YG47_9PSEU|nr:DUF4232 domain-containing protein [Amycolatopsis saalfeldensis]SEP51086.1 Protein of unknown function [Amycolatopsis saalfeldensis]
MVNVGMKRVSIGVAAVAGAFALAACGSGASQPAAAPAGPAAGSGAVGGAGGGGVSDVSKKSPDTAPKSGTAPKSSSDSTPRCTTADLSASLGSPKQHEDAVGQFDVPLKYTNTSSHSCALHGVPGVDLVGPDDPNGTTYHLPRIDNGVPMNVVEPGQSATATVTVLTQTPGSVGSLGSTGWTPSRLVTIPPGQTQALTVAWPSSLTVLRQDSATHPGTFVNGILADPPA